MQHFVSPARVARGKVPADYPTDYRVMLDPLLSMPTPDLPRQRVHADLTGNVVFDAGMAPGIIDPTHYWRSRPVAEGVVLVNQGWFASAPDLEPFVDAPALGAMVHRAAAPRIAEQPEQVATGVKNADEALATANQISHWASAVLDRLGGNDLRKTVVTFYRAEGSASFCFDWREGGATKARFWRSATESGSDGQLLRGTVGACADGAL